MGNIVEIKGVNKIYGKNHVVKDLNLNRLIGFTLQYKLLSDTISPNLLSIMLS